MGKLAGIGFINAFVDDVRQTQKDKAALTEKRAARTQANEIFKLRKQKFEMDIKEQELKRTITPTRAKNAREQYKAIASGWKAKYDIEGLLQDEKDEELMGRDKRNLSLARQLQNLPYTESATLTEGPGGTTLTRSIKPATPKKETSTQQFEDASRSFVSGDLPLEDFKSQFPTRGKKIKDVQVGALNPKTTRIFSDAVNILKDNKNSEQDLSDLLFEFIERRDEGEEKGVQIDKILEILGITEEEIKENKEGFIGKILSGIREFF